MKSTDQPPGSAGEPSRYEALVFEWHSRKAAENLKKHGVSFDEAKTIFGDENHLVLPDAEHSFD